ncbi:MAG: tRNA (adenosine(37)-N6)-dimethylallyltransferase MiaA [Myxococcota bacterium]
MKPELFVIAGPTASGKTSAAITLAERWGAEIVSADSQQVYRHFDIGTAKPSPEQLQRVPHHLISIVEPNEPFSAARFQALADEAIAGIVSRGRRVLVVGGTGLYVRVLLHGVAVAPGSDPALRARLAEEARAIGREALHRRLADIDPQTAAQVKPRDLLRVIRALEIHARTGTPASIHRAAHRFEEDRYPHRLFVLSPPRKTLYAAIDHRTEAMFEAGLVSEVRGLLARGFRDAPPMRSVGYAQALAVVEGRMSLPEAIGEAAQKTRHYAKRQLTWFKKERGARRVESPEALLASVLGSP